MAAQYAALGANIVQEMNDDEGFSNGVWNSIINHYLPLATHLVLPEYRVGGGRPDLLVYTNANPPFPVLVFEGKHGGGGSAAWDKATEQALGYINSIGGRNLAMVALGDKCRFFGNYGGDDRQLEPDAANGNATWKKRNKGVVTKLDVNADRVQIHDSLLLVVNNAAIPN